MHSHSFLTCGNLNTISVVTPVMSKPTTSIYPSHTLYVSDEESERKKG